MKRKVSELLPGVDIVITAQQANKVVSMKNPSMCTSHAFFSATPFSQILVYVQVQGTRCRYKVQGARPGHAHAVQMLSQQCLCCTLDFSRKDCYVLDGGLGVEIEKKGCPDLLVCPG